MASKRRPSDGTEPLFVEVPHDVGRTQRAVLDVVEAARSQGLLDDLHAALAQLAVEAARAVDRANAIGDPYAFSQPARELRELLTALGLVPTAAKGGEPRDPFDDLFAELDAGGTTPAARDSSDRPA